MSLAEEMKARADKAAPERSKRLEQAWLYWYTKNAENWLWQISEVADEGATSVTVQWQGADQLLNDLIQYFEAENFKVQSVEGSSTSFVINW